MLLLLFLAMCPTIYFPFAFDDIAQTSFMTGFIDDCFVQLHSGLQSGGAMVLFLRDRVVEAYLVPQIKILSFDAYISF